MERKTQLLITFSILVIFIAGLYVFTDWFSKVTGYFTGEEELVKLAQCLKEKGTEFYGNAYCADCEKQEKFFGSAFGSITNIDCGKNQENCPNIREIPAWYINGEIYYGYKNITELKEISECV